MKKLGCLAIAMGLFVTRPAAADNWDQAATINDSSAATTTNELVHGTVQLHDVDPINSGLANDEDWYFVSIKPYSSYEVVVDATTPFMNRLAPVSLTLVQSDGTVDTTDHPASSLGYTRSLRIRNETATVNDDRWVRVLAPDCATVCGTIYDNYVIRMLETTFFVPRYNNSGTQTTILVLQNPTDSPVSANARFWSSAGALVASSVLTVNPHSATTLNTSTVAAGSTGSVSISHDAPYGSLSGKAVALEPATGFTFDTTMVPRYN